MFISNLMRMATAGVGGFAEGRDITWGSDYIFNTTTANYNGSDFDSISGDKYVVGYRDNNNNLYGTARIGSISDTALSFGSKAVFNSARIDCVGIAFDPNTSNKFVVTFNDDSNGNYGTAVVGTVSGTSISFGSKYVFNSGQINEGTDVQFDPNNANKFVIVYRDSVSSSDGTAIVGTVSGTTLSFGSEYVYETSTNQTEPKIGFDPNSSGKFVIDYKNNSVVGTISGTTISYGTKAGSGLAGDPQGGLAFDPNTAGRYLAIGASGNIKVGTVSGTTISLATGTDYSTGSADEEARVMWDYNNEDKFIICYLDKSNSDYGTVKIGDISGSTITWGSPYVFNSGGTNYMSIVSDRNNSGKFVINYMDSSNSGKGTSVVGQIYDNS